MKSADIQLLNVQRAHTLALRQGKSNLQDLLKVSIPEGWSQFPEAFDPSHQPFDAWPAYFFLCPSEHALVGNGGYAGPPSESGELEIGYEIAPLYANRGFATAAVRAMLKFAFSQPEVQAVVAHTLAEENASNAVLRKTGFPLVEELPNAEVGAVWRWRISRAVHDYLALVALPQEAAALRSRVERSQ